MATYGYTYEDEDDYFVEEYPEGGDPYGAHDSRYGSGQAATAIYVPDLVCDFLKGLQRAIKSRNVLEIQNLYENTYVQLTEDHFKSTPWPNEAEVNDVLGETTVDKTFTILYKELYYRHIYARCSPSVDDRFESYYNYCHLFNYILNAETPVVLELPNQWLWDIIDEFIYQFQSFSLFRTRVNKLQPEEVDQLQTNPKVWNVHSVLNVLHSLVDKSNINEQLREINNGRDPNKVTGIFGRHPLYSTLGYYAIIGLLRLNSLLGDYYQAIKVLENIDLNKAQMFPFARLLPCQMTTYYYVGFAYMMMRRYADCIRTFSTILVYLQRSRHIFPQHRTLQVDMIDKQTDQMYRLLTICLVLHPQRVDESVATVLQEKESDVVMKLQRDDLKPGGEFESSFRFACPKFVSPVPARLAEQYSNPARSSAANERMEPWRQQWEVFRTEVKQHLPILNIRSYLKLYTTMPIEKLAAFCPTAEDKNEEEEDQLGGSGPAGGGPALGSAAAAGGVVKSQDDELLAFHSQLLCYKHKMQNLVRTKESTTGLGGEFQSGSDVDFYADRDMIHIADTKVARRYGDYFLRQIHKFEELYRHVSGLKI